MFIFFFVITAGIILDQWIKIMVIANLKSTGSIPVIDGIFHLTYVENTGAAFSILSGRQYILIAMTFLIIVMTAFLLYRNIKDKKGMTLFKDSKTDPMWIFNLSVSFILAGAVGNFIDRVRFNYVVDFFDFRLINFAIFNVADCFIVVGTILAAVLLIFTKVDPFGN